MKLLLDESVDVRLGIFLVAQGHDVKAIGVDYPHALADEEVLAISVAEERILMTNDRDFGELIVRERRQHRGVILFRLRSRSILLLQERASRTLSRYSTQSPTFLVVTEQRVRIRA
jgi:predicted nuclease of predicted toxin-antitoxin system